MERIRIGYFFNIKNQEEMKKIMIKTCVICGKKFETRTREEVCSERCREILVQHISRNRTVQL